jgi:hypothetical protein
LFRRSISQSNITNPNSLVGRFSRLGGSGFAILFRFLAILVIRGKVVGLRWFRELLIWLQFRGWGLMSEWRGSRIGFGEVLVIGRQVEVVELVWIQFKIRVMIL